MIAKRRVYFLSGFDPRGSSFYHRLYREESRKQSKLNKAKIAVGKRQRSCNFAHKWNISANWDGTETQTDYRFLAWDDLIRQCWVERLPSLIGRSLLMYLWHIRIGLLKQFKQAGRGPFLSSIFPLIYVVAAALIISLIAIILGGLVYSLTDSLVVATIISVALIVFLTKQARKLGDKLGVWWIMQTYLFLATWGKQPIASIDERINLFAEQILNDFDESPVEEIVLIGHCVGTILAVSTLAKLLQKNHAQLVGKLKLITLGQCIPYVSYPQTSGHFRSELKQVIENQTIPWIDMGARADPLCFDQVDPTVAEGLIIYERNWPRKKQIKPYLMYSPETYSKLKKDKLRIHFQYLMSSELLTDYDYFQLTSSPAEITVSTIN